MRFRLFGALAVASLITAPVADASAPDFCASLGADWDGQYCHTSVPSERKAVRDIKVAVPGDLIDNPVTGPTIRDYLTQLVNNWRSVGVHMVADSFGEENFQVLQRGDVLSVVFHEDYHADGPKPNNAFRTFTWDMARGVRAGAGRCAEARGGLRRDRVAGSALHRGRAESGSATASAGHAIRSSWTGGGPDKVYSGGYKAWALSGDELILYMPDYPVGHDSPINYTPGIMQWSMDGGTVQAHIPLAALSSVLRPQFGGA